MFQMTYIPHAQHKNKKKSLKIKQMPLEALNPRHISGCKFGGKNKTKK